RLVPSDESVFDIVMRWISWPLGDRVGNYLIVKGDSISSKLNDDDNAEQVWRISDFLWFIGAEAKRHPPAKSKTLPFMGVALSFKQESDQLRLLSAVYSENPLISVSNCV
ncbi:hypothetical protein D917_04914, partial [Trichinella nativa]